MNNELNDTQRTILIHMNERFSDMTSGYDSFEDWTGMKRKELKPLMLDLRNKGYVTYERGCMNDDGDVAGSGYCITPKGEATAELQTLKETI